VLVWISHVAQIERARRKVLSFREGVKPSRRREEIKIHIRGLSSFDTDYSELA